MGPSRNMHKDADVGLGPFTPWSTSLLISAAFCLPYFTTRTNYSVFHKAAAKGYVFKFSVLALNTTKSWCTLFFGEVGSSSTSCCNLCDHVTLSCCLFAHVYFSRETYLSPTCLIPLLVPWTQNPLGTHFSLPHFERGNGLVWLDRVFVTEKCVGGLSYSSSVEEVLLFIRIQDRGAIDCK